MLLVGPSKQDVLEHTVAEHAAGRTIKAGCAGTYSGRASAGRTIRAGYAGYFGRDVMVTCPVIFCSLICNAGLPPTFCLSTYSVETRYGHL